MSFWAKCLLGKCLLGEMFFEGSGFWGKCSLREVSFGGNGFGGNVPVPHSHKKKQSVVNGYHIRTHLS